MEISTDKEIAQDAVRELKDAWGGRMPTWEEFEEAYKAGRVRFNKTVARVALNDRRVPRIYDVLYGIIVPWAVFFVVPVTIVLWLVFKISGWWILVSVAAVGYLYRAWVRGPIRGMGVAALRNESLYDALVRNGAFLFRPADQSRTPQTSADSGPRGRDEGRMD
jgi:hypothetical protein